MITVLYTCNACGIKDRAVQVPARSTEDVVVWMREVVGLTVGNDHLSVSSHCHAKTMTHVKIPIPEEAEFIGQQIE